MHSTLPWSEDIWVFFPVGGGGGGGWRLGEAGSAKVPRNCWALLAADWLPGESRGKEKKELHLVLLQNQTYEQTHLTHR